MWARWHQLFRDRPGHASGLVGPQRFHRGGVGQAKGQPAERDGESRVLHVSVRRLGLGPRNVLAKAGQRARLVDGNE